MADTMSTVGFTLFATPVGQCAIARGPLGLTGVQLAEQDVAATREKMV